MNQTTMIAPRGVLQSGSAGQNRSRKSPSCHVAANGRIGLTVEEAAAYTGIGRNTIRQLVGWGKIPVLKIDRKMIIRADVIDRFMEVNQGVDLLDQSQVRCAD